MARCNKGIVNLLMLDPGGLVEDACLKLPQIRAGYPDTGASAIGHMLLATACACGDDADLGSGGPPVRDIDAGSIHNVVH